MLFRTEDQKRDLAWNWHRGDRAFFQGGACHILADAFLRRFPATGFRPVMIQPVAGFRGGHVVAASPTEVFDWHGFSDRDRYLAHHFRKLRHFFPGWNATVSDLDEFMTPAFFAKFNHRAPGQYLRDPRPRAEAFVSRLMLHRTSLALRASA
jgi:hypothetical protein